MYVCMYVFIYVCIFTCVYIILKRCTEHQQDSIKGNWESSGATEHTQECHGQFK